MLDPQKVKVFLTFDDVLLLPAYSNVLPANVDISAQLTRKIKLNCPLLSAPMDTVTETNLAIALAQEGGIGIIHRNLQPDQQRKMVDKVKRAVSAMIPDPITMEPGQKIHEALAIMRKYRIIERWRRRDGSTKLSQDVVSAQGIVGRPNNFRIKRIGNTPSIFNKLRRCLSTAQSK